MLLYTPPLNSHIPVIDLGASFSGRLSDRIVTSEEIHRAARDTGFFYVKNHGITASITERAFAASRRFFDLCADEKQEVAMQKGEPRGYEALASQVLDNGSPGDLKEAFSFAADLPADHPSFADGTPNSAANRWPKGLFDFRDVMLGYHQSLCTLGNHLMHLIALSLDMPEHFFDDAYRFANPTARLLRYPPQPHDAAFNQLGAGAHTDWGGITLLAQHGVAGLEVKSRGGDWLRAEPIAGTLVINLGDMIARWTNDLYHSTPHRVMNDVSGSDRYSIALFYSPSYHTHVECLPTCLSPGETPKYAPCTAGEHVHQKRLAAYGAS